MTRHLRRRHTAYQCLMTDTTLDLCQKRERAAGPTCLWWSLLGRTLSSGTEGAWSSFPPFGSPVGLDLLTSITSDADYPPASRHCGRHRRHAGSSRLSTSPPPYPEAVTDRARMRLPCLPRAVVPRGRHERGSAPYDVFKTSSSPE